MTTKIAITVPATPSTAARSSGLASASMIHSITHATAAEEAATTTIAAIATP